MFFFLIQFEMWNEKETTSIINCRQISSYLSLQAAEAGNLDDFIRLYQADNTRLKLQDGKGRTAAHQAASRNRVNILQYIRDQNGGKWRTIKNLFF